MDLSLTRRDEVTGWDEVTEVGHIRLYEYLYACVVLPRLHAGGPVLVWKEAHLWATKLYGCPSQDFLDQGWPYELSQLPH